MMPRPFYWTLMHRQWRQVSQQPNELLCCQTVRGPEKQCRCEQACPHTSSGPATSLHCAGLLGTH